MNNNMNKLMQQAKNMEDTIKKIKQDQRKIEVEGQSGAGLIKIIMTGKHDIKNVKIDKSLLSEKKEIIEDLIAAAINNAVHKVEEQIKLDINNISQNINLPSEFKFPF